MPKLPDADRPVGDKPETPGSVKEKSEKEIKDMLKRAGRKVADVDGKSMKDKTETKKALLELHNLSLEHYTRGYIG